jgi:hypothetical protein
VPVGSTTATTIYSPEMLDTFLRAYPAVSGQGGKFAVDLTLALQNHLPLSVFQKMFIFIVAFIPSPLSWKLAVFSFLYTLPSTAFPLYPLLIAILVLGIGTYLLRHYIRLRFARKEPFTFLELIVPASTAKSAYATEQFFTLLHSLAGQRRALQRLIGHKKCYSLELIATREEGIRYIVGVSKKDASVIEKGLLSYLPGLSIKPAPEFSTNQSKKTKEKLTFTELKLSSNFVLPLSAQKELGEHDPIAYLTGNMTKLRPGEKMTFQIVASPVSRSDHRHIFRHLNKIHRLIAQNKPLSDELFKTPVQQALTVPVAILTVTLKIVEALLTFISTLIVSLFDSRPIQTLVSPKGMVTQQALNPYEEELQIQVKEKMDQALFEVSVRLVILAEEKDIARARTAGFLASMAPFTSPYQSLEPKGLSLDFTNSTSRFTERRLSSFQNPVLTPSELTDLYHFPFTDTTKTEGLITSRSRDLPAPLSQKRNAAALDVVIGTNTYGGEHTSVGLTAEQRHQHTYIVGKTGMGKSTILAGMALQDMTDGKGLAVVDPHGDLVTYLLENIPESRRKDVVYFNPADKEWPVGLNILNPGITFDDPEEQCEWITASVMSVFMKITPKDKWGQRMEHILRNTVLTALAIEPSATTPYICLFTVQQLLTNTKYRKQAATSLQDPILKQFWLKEFALFGSMQQADAISPLANKLGEFLTSPLSRRILLQEKTSINLSEVMDSGKILLVNLSKGTLGEERSAFFGTLIVSLIQLSTYARAQIPESKRRDFFVYIDEFQNFATSHFTSLFSESRKYHVFFIPTHQSIAQIEDTKISNVISGNAGTLISLKVGPDDEQFILPFMHPEVKEGEMVNLLPHHFFMKVTSGISEDSFSGETIPLGSVGSEEVAEEIINHSRKHYATPRAEVEEQLAALLRGNLSTPKDPKKAVQKASNSQKKVVTVTHDVD